MFGLVFFSRTFIDFKFETVTDLYDTVVRNVKKLLENAQQLEGS